MSGWQLGRLERRDLAQPTLEQLCRAARAVGLRPWFKLYPDEAPVRDAAQLKLLARFEQLLAPLRLARGPASGRLDGARDAAGSRIGRATASIGRTRDRRPPDRGRAIAAAGDPSGIILR